MSTPTLQNQQVDVRGPRFGAWITTAVLVAVLCCHRLDPRRRPAGGAQAVVFAVGAFAGLRRALRRALPRRWSRPGWAPSASASPRRRRGSPSSSAWSSPPSAPPATCSARRVLGAVATGFALVAALLNAATGFCLGCEIYLHRPAGAQPARAVTIRTTDSNHGGTTPMSRDDVLVSADWAEENLGTPRPRLRRGRRGHQPPTTAATSRAPSSSTGSTDLQDPVRRDFVDKEQFEALLSAQGHRQRRHRRPLRRQQQLVRRLRLLVLQAVRPRRRQADRRRPQEVGARRPRAVEGRRRAARPPSTQAEEPDLSIRAFRDEVVAAIGTQEPGRRPLARRVLRQAPRAGAPAAGAGAAGRPHPDRAQRPVEQGRQRGRHLQVRRGAARSSTPRPGFDDSKDTIAYCRIGERSSHTWFVLQRAARQAERQELRRLLDRVRLAGRRPDREGS